MDHISMVKEVSSQRKVNTRTFTVVHLMYLMDSQHLLPEQEVPRCDPKAPRVFWSHLPQEFHTQPCPFMSLHVLSCPFMSTVRWRQGCHRWTFPTWTWWIKPGSLGGMRKATAALQTSSPTSRRVASWTSTASPCPGSCCMITAPWGFCTLCLSTEGRVTPKCWLAPWPGGSLRKVFRSTVS